MRCRVIGRTRWLAPGADVRQSTIAASTAARVGRPLSLRLGRGAARLCGWLLRQPGQRLGGVRRSAVLCVADGG